MALPSGFTLVPALEEEKQPQTVTLPAGFSLVEPEAEPEVKPAEASKVQLPEGFTLVDAAPQAEPTPEPEMPPSQGFAPVDLSKYGIETDRDKLILRELIGKTETADPKVLNKLNTIAEERLATAKQKAAQAMRTGASQEDASEIFVNALTPVESIKGMGQVQYPDSTKQMLKNAFTRGAFNITGTAIGTAGVVTGLAEADRSVDNVFGAVDYTGAPIKTANVVTGSTRAEDTTKDLLEASKKFSELAELYPARERSVVRAEEVGGKATALLEGFIENTPSMIEAIALGGAGRSAAVAAAEKYAARVGLSKKATEEVVEKFAKRGAFAGAGAASVGMESGAILGDIYSETGQIRPGVAAAFGSLAGALDMITPGRAVNTAMNKQIAEELGKTIMQRYGAEALKSASIEFPTEFVQTLIEKGALSFVDGRPVLTKENLIDALDAGIIGFGMGAGATAAGQGVADVSQALSGMSREDMAKYYGEAAQADDAQARAMEAWKTRGLTPSTSGTAVPTPTQEAATAPVTGAPQVGEPPAQPTITEPVSQELISSGATSELVNNPRFVQSVANYEKLGYLRDEAVTLAKLEISDEEAENARRADAEATRRSVPIPRQPEQAAVAGAPAELNRPPVAGVGGVEGTTQNGEKTQPAALVQPAEIENLKLEHVEAAKTLPPAPEGTTRLWQNIQDASVAPTTFTSDFDNVALPSITESTQALAYIDVPTEIAEEYVAQGANAPALVELPEEYVGKATPIVTPRIEPSDRSTSIAQVQESLGKMYSPGQLKRNAPKVVFDYAELPDNLRQQAEELGAKAFVDPNTKQEYYIASQIPSNDVVGTILHERGGHIGLEKLVGKDKVSALSNRVTTWAEASGNALENKIAREAVGQADVSGEEIGSDRYKQEVIAYFTEIAVNRYGIDPLKTQPKEAKKVAGWLRDLWNSVTAALKKLNMNPDQLTASDIVNLVYGASRVATRQTEELVPRAAGSEGPSVFTPEVLQELITVLADSPKVSTEIANEKEETPPKIQASAKNMVQKLGLPSPSVEKTFIETYYDNFKSIGTTMKDAVYFAFDALDKSIKVPEVNVTPERLLAQLPEFTLYNLVNEYRLRDIWENPEEAASQLSYDLTLERKAESRRAADVVQRMLRSPVVHSYSLDAAIKTPERAAFIGAMLKSAITKYSMAGNKAVVMTEKNEYLPIKDKDISPEFVEDFTKKLDAGFSIKAAFESAYSDVALAPRTGIIKQQLGESQTGWMRFTEPSQADDMRLVTSDTGGTRGNWCIGRSSNHGENYLTNSDMYVYVNEGKSLVAAETDKTTGAPKKWYGIEAAQTVPKHHEYIKDTIPSTKETLSEDVKEELKKQKTEEENTKRTYSEAENILKEIKYGDVSAIEQTLLAGVTSPNTGVDYALKRAVGSTLTRSVGTIAGLTDPQAIALQTALDTIKKVADSTTYADIMPELAAKANVYKVITYTDSVKQTPEQLPAHVKEPIVQLILSKSEGVIDSWEGKSPRERIEEKLDEVTSTAPRVARSVTYGNKYVEAIEDYLRGVRDTNGDGLSYAERDATLTSLYDYYRNELKPVQGTVSINLRQTAKNEGTVVFSVNGYSSESKEYVNGFIRDAYEKILERQTEDRNSISVDGAKEKYLAREVKSIAESAAEAIKTLGMEERIQASRRSKPKPLAPNPVLETIRRSEYPAELGSAIVQLAGVRNFDDAKSKLLAVYKSGESSAITFTLPMMTTMQITDLVGDKIPHLPQINRYVQKMSVMRTKHLAVLADAIEPWEAFQKRSKKGAVVLSRMMHYATMASFDPSRFSSLNDALARDVELQELKDEVANSTSPQQRGMRMRKVRAREQAITDGYRMWNELGTFQNGKGHEIFRTIRDHYKAQFNLHRAILEERIAALDVEGDINDASTPKGKLMASIRLSYINAINRGVYFPLMRYGKYWTRVGKGVNREFYMFESEAERNLFVDERVKQLNNAGDTRTRDDMITDQDIDIGNDFNKLRGDIQESSEMLKEIFKTIDTQRTLDRQGLKDSIYQMYLLTLPEGDLRKQLLHRQLISGFNPDALRNFARYSYSAASQLARLKYAPVIMDEIQAAKDALTGNPEKVTLGLYLNEIYDRINEELNPYIPDLEERPIPRALESLSRGVNQAGFFWMLTSASSALLNVSSIPIFGYPVLASHFGKTNTAVTLGKYMNVYNHMTIQAKDVYGETRWVAPSVGLSKHVQSNPILKAAFEVASNQLNITNITRSFDMLDLAHTPSLVERNPIMAGKDMIVNASGALFHHSERLIRETMFMVGFELAYEKAKSEGLAAGVNGPAFDRAVNEAERYTDQALFKYQSYDRPTVMRGSLGRMAFQFSLYAQQVIGYYVRNGYSMIMGSTTNPNARKEAMTQLVGTSLMIGAFGGITGIFGYNAALAVVQGIIDALRDDDEPVYIEERDMHLYFVNEILPKYFGNDSDFAKIFGKFNWNQIIEKGPVSVLTDIDIASRVSQADIWFRDTRTDGTSEDAITSMLIDMMGPGVGLARRFASGYDDIRKGYVSEGITKFLPANIRDAYTTYVWADQGVKAKTSRAEIMTPEEMTKSRLFWRFLGFNPTELSRVQNTNYRMNSLINEVESQRSEILGKLFLALDKNNDAAFEEGLEEVARFNRNNPSFNFIIDVDTIFTSLYSRTEIAAMANRGLKVPEDLQGQIYEFVYPSRPQE